MKAKNLELKVGIFIVLSVIVLIFGYLWMKQAKMKSQGYRITIHFNNATGLKRGDPVWVLGVQKGRVLSIELAGNKVSTRCYLDNDVVLKKDAQAAIKDVALISGTKFIELNVGEDKELLDISKPITGKGSPTFSLGELGDILDPIKSIAEKIGSGDVEKTLEHISTTAQELAALVKENRPGIKRTVRKAEKDLDKLVAVADKLDKNLDMLSGVLKDIKEGKGTVGKLMQDEELYNELESTLKETKALLKDIKENPKKYINIRVF